MNHRPYLELFSRHQRASIRQTARVCGVDAERLAMWLWLLACDVPECVAWEQVLVGQQGIKRDAKSN